MAKDLVPVPSVDGMDTLQCPSDMDIVHLRSAHLAEMALGSLIPPDGEEANPLTVSIDAEWNISRTVGISILQILLHSAPNTVYIVHVGYCHQSLLTFSH